MQENGLDASLRVLQSETAVTMDRVLDAESLLADIRAGSWDVVLSTLSSIRVGSHKVLYDLHEQIFWELAEAGEVEAARMLLRQGEVLGGLLREADENRYMGLENGLSSLMMKTGTDKPPKQQHDHSKKRAKIAHDLAPHLHAVPKGRLLTLLGEAMRYEQQQMFKEDHSSSEYQFDIFHGMIPRKLETVVDAIPTTCFKEVPMPAGQHIEAAAFSPDGSLLAVGLADGFIEIWWPQTGKLREDLAFQSGHRSDFMVMETAILSIAFSPDGALLAVGTLNGDMAVWRASSGTCVKRFPKAHTGGISSVHFSPDSLSVLTAGYDAAIRIFNLRTGAMQRQLVGHTEFVHQAVFASQGQRVLSASSDGSLRCWNAKTGECLEKISPCPHDQLAQKTVKTVVAIPRHSDTFLVCAQDTLPALYSSDGVLQRELKWLQKRTSLPNFTSACCSPSGKYIYIAADDKQLYCFDFASGNMLKSFGLTKADEFIGFVHHPCLNMLLSFDMDNLVKLWH